MRAAICRQRSRSIFNNREPKIDIARHAIPLFEHLPGDRQRQVGKGAKETHAAYLIDRRFQLEQEGRTGRQRFKVAPAARLPEIHVLVGALRQEAEPVGVGDAEVVGHGGKLRIIAALVILARFDCPVRAFLNYHRRKVIVILLVGPFLFDISLALKLPEHTINSAP